MFGAIEYHSKQKISLTGKLSFGLSIVLRKMTSFGNEMSESFWSIDSSRTDRSVMLAMTRWTGQARQTNPAEQIDDQVDPT